MGIPSKAPRQQAALEARRTDALRLRVQGLPFSKIAAAIGVSKETAVRYVHSALAEQAEERSHMAAQYTELLLLSTDADFAALGEAAEAGDTRAIDTRLRIRDFQARLLGLYPKEDPTPTTVNILVNGVRWEDV